jgi:hypothetical protein
MFWLQDIAVTLPVVDELVILKCRVLACYHSLKSLQTAINKQSLAKNKIRRFFKWKFQSRHNHFGDRIVSKLLLKKHFFAFQFRSVNYSIKKTCNVGGIQMIKTMAEIKFQNRKSRRRKEATESESGSFVFLQTVN